MTHEPLSPLVMKARNLAGFLLVPLLIQWVLASSSSAYADEAAPAKTPDCIFWSADHETGDLRQWDDGPGQDHGGGIFNTGEDVGDAKAAITDEVAHSGKYSVRMTIRNASGQHRAVRLMRWKNVIDHAPWNIELPDEAYYSAWFYFPREYKTKVWWNIFQFKSQDDARTMNEPMWVVNVDGRGSPMRLYLWNKFNEPASHKVQLANPPLTLPVRQWVHIEVFYKQAADKTGRVTVWQDGTLIYDVKDVQTAIGNRVTWGIGNYTDDIEPPDVTIYTDDAVVSTKRIGVTPENSIAR